MPAAFGSGSTLAAGTRTNSTITAPASIANGDVLLYILSIGGAAGPTATPPAGFAIVDASWPMAYSRPDPWAVKVYAWWKIASGESGNYAATHSSAATEGYIYRITGADATPINPTPTKTEDSNNVPEEGTLTAPGLTTPVDGSMVISVYGVWDTLGASTPPAGTTPTFTERKDSGALYVADGILATAGATGDKSITMTPNQQAWAAGLISIEAAVGGGVSIAAIASNFLRFGGNN